MLAIGEAAFGTLFQGCHHGESSHGMGNRMHHNSTSSHDHFEMWGMLEDQH